MTSTLVVADAVSTPGGPVGDAVLIDGSRVAAVGAATDLRSSGVEELTFPSATIVPGLRDAHLHPVPYAAVINGVVLKDAADIRTIQDELRRAAARSTVRRPLFGHRLDDETLAEKRLPTRDDIDAAVADRPVLLKRYCGHIAVANSAALGVADIDATTADPAGGILDRDASGRPTGVLRETAIDLVATRLDASDVVGVREIVSVLRGLAGLGITSIGAMLGLGNGPWASLGDEVDLLVRAAEQLPIRVNAFVVASDPGELRAAAARLEDTPPRLRWLGVKQFADGSLGGHTAAMFDPFADAPDQRGTIRLRPEDHATATEAIELGGMVAIHAIGDRACSLALDQFATLIGAGADPARLRLEHASVLRREDVDRLAAMRVVASVQPAFLGSEGSWLERRVGPGRLHTTYPFRELHDAGVVLAGGSDCPVEAPYPLVGMALARDRAGIVPAQRLDAIDAFAMFTTGAAIALGEDQPLAIGSPADLAILDVDPAVVTPDELRTARVLATFVDGETVPVDRGASVWAG